MKIWRAEGAGDEFALAEKVVVDAVDLVAAVEEPRQQTRGDESGRAGDHDLHASAARVFANSSGLPIS